MAQGSSVFRRIIQLVLDAQSVARTKAALQDALQKGTDAKGVKKNLTAVDKAIVGLRRTALGLGAAFLGIFSARKLLDYADTWRLIQGRLKLVTDGALNLGRVTERLQGIANRTRTSFEGVATLFQRIAMNADELGRTQAELLDITETVSKSIQIGGASASESAAGVQQLAQALASGRLQGDEFRSIMENMPDLARRLAQELGVTTGQLRAMSKAGELTADVITGAILRMKESVDEDFRSVPATIGGAFQVLGNEIMEFVGQADDATGASSALAEGLLEVAGAISAIGDAFQKTKSFFEIDTRIEDWFKKNVSDPMRESLGLGSDSFFNRQTGRFEKRATTEPDNLLRDRPNVSVFDPSLGKREEFERLLSRLESERTDQIVKTKAAHVATAAEVAELNDLYAQGNAALRAGNLSLDDRFALTTALASLGFEEAKARTAEELLKLEDERIGMLLEARELGIQTAAEDAELVRFQQRFNDALTAGNLSLDARLRATAHLKEINDALEGKGLFRRAPTQMDLLLQDGVTDLPGMDREKNPIRAPDLGDNRDLAETYRNQWLDAHAEVLAAAESTAFGAMGAWSDAIGLLFEEGAGLQQFMEGLFRGMGAAALGGLAQYASAKVAENIALAVEEAAKAAGSAAVFDVAGATAHAAASKGHGVAAIKWGLVGGVAAAGQSALSSGRGGQSGGIPSGARDPAGRLADKANVPPTIINIYSDPLDPRSGRYQTNVGEALVNFNQRRGQRITDGSRRTNVS